jgi:PPP family 3-phenylpropionic acid transporter
VLWSAGVAAEVTVFFLSGDEPPLRCLDADPLRSRRLRLPLAAVSDALGLSGFFLLQCLHAFSFAFVHTGVQRRIVASVQATQESSAQGAYFFYNGMFMALMTIASGYLYAFARLASYYVMALSPSSVSA